MNYKEFIRQKIEQDPELVSGMNFYGWLIELGLRIRDKRRSMKMSQSEMAKKMKVSQSVIARIECGQNMNCLTLWKLSEALGVDLEVFGVSKEKEESEFYHFYYGETDQENILKQKDTKCWISNISSIMLPSHTTKLP